MTAVLVNSELRTCMARCLTDSTKHTQGSWLDTVVAHAYPRVCRQVVSRMMSTRRASLSGADHEISLKRVLVMNSELILGMLEKT